MKSQSQMSHLSLHWNEVLTQLLYCQSPECAFHINFYALVLKVKTLNQKLFWKLKAVIPFPFLVWAWIFSSLHAWNEPWVCQHSWCDNSVTSASGAWHRNLGSSHIPVLQQHCLHVLAPVLGMPSALLGWLILGESEKTGSILTAELQPSSEHQSVC